MCDQARADTPSAQTHKLGSPTEGRLTYRKVPKLAPTRHYDSYTDPGVLICEPDTRCDEPLSVFTKRRSISP